MIHVIHRHGSDTNKLFYIEAGDSIVLYSYRWSGGREHQYRYIRQSENVLDEPLILIKETNETNETDKINKTNKTKIINDQFTLWKIAFTFPIPGHYVLEVAQRCLKRLKQAKCICSYKMHIFVIRQAGTPSRVRYSDV